jgi:menaquinone-dependent protoporphyrinogen oxidase
MIPFHSDTIIENNKYEMEENHMSQKVLVTYGTKHGATAEIAEKIGAVLKENGLETDVLPVKDVSNPAPYSAVVLGSAVYVGGWRKEAAKFLKGNEDILKQKPVWIFSSGPTGEGDAVELMQGWDFPKKLLPVIERIAPKGRAVFHGDLNPEKLSSLEKWMIKKVKAPIGDFRDWDAVTSWASDIAAALK